MRGEENTRRAEDGLSNMVVVLNEPRYPENIGAAARCCRNMGIPLLRVVRPLNLDLERVLKMATHEARGVVEAMEEFDTLEGALADCHFVVGTTARRGRMRRPTLTPRALASILPSMTLSNRVALLFGSEKFGLTNSHLKFCHEICTIPTAEFTSINLAQSVMILCYEAFLAHQGPIEYHVPRLATTQERESMFGHLEEVFRAVGLNDAKEGEYWRLKMRRILGHHRLTAREVKFIRGFCRHVLNSLKGAGRG